ncbi:MAG: GyrI-like domain-containing protein [Sulfitobacter sp.]
MRIEKIESLDLFAIPVSDENLIEDTFNYLEAWAQSKGILEGASVVGLNGRTNITRKYGERSNLPYFAAIAPAVGREAWPLLEEGVMLPIHISSNTYLTMELCGHYDLIDAEFEKLDAACAVDEGIKSRDDYSLEFYLNYYEDCPPEDWHTKLCLPIDKLQV